MATIAYEQAKAAEETFSRVSTEAVRRQALKALDDIQALEELIGTTRAYSWYEYEDNKE